MKERALDIFDKTFAPTAALKGATLVVALLGVATALMAILLERSRELAVMGYLGLTPREIAATNIQQGLIMGSLAFIPAAVSGLMLTYVIIHAINYRSFGWSIDIFISPWIFGKLLLLTMAACLISSAYPTYKLTKSSSRSRLEDE
jgi:putative ABC transport system permease protein